MNGSYVKRFSLPRYPTRHIAQEIENPKGDKFLMLWVDQQATSHSSTLFIIDSNWQIKYKEYLLGALWLAFPKERPIKSFILAPDTHWRPNDEWLRIGGPWKYSLD